VLGALALTLTGAPARRATTTSPPSRAGWHLVGLGGSITSGQDCPGCTPFLDLYGQQITDDTAIPVSLTNLATPGATSADLLTSLSDQVSAREVAGADIITITIGANDFIPMLTTALDDRCNGPDGLGCFAGALARLGTDIGAILDRVRQLRHAQPTAIRVLGYWNVFLDGAVGNSTYGPAFQTTSAALTQRVNALLARAAPAHQATYVDLYGPFKGVGGADDDTALLTADGDHPSQAGHEEIAEALTAAGYAPLKTQR
jgi:lysophospholipase L1-like esterase